MKHLYSLILVLFCALPLQAEEPLFGGNSDLVGLLRINAISDMSRRTEELFLSINPHSTFRDPVRNWLSTLLRNPNLRGVAADAYAEVLFFDPQRINGTPFAIAFPVEDVSGYAKELTSQASIRQEGIQNDIISLREITQDEPRALYLTTSPNGIAVFSSGQEAVARARTMYLHRGRNGVMPKGQADIQLALHVRSLMGIYAREIATAQEELGADILQDVVESASADHPLAQGLSVGFANLRESLGQIEQLEAEFVLGRDEINLETRLRPVPESRLARFCSNRPPAGLKPDLLEALPETWHLTHQLRIWPQLWQGVWDHTGNILSAAMGNQIDKPTRNQFLLLRNTLKRANPVELVSGLLGPPPDSPSRAPVRIQLIRWRSPDVLPTLFATMETLAKKSAIRETLSQFGSRLIYVYTPKAEQLDGLPVDRLRIHLEMPEAWRGEARAASFFGEPQDYFLARHEDILLLATQRYLGSQADRKPARDAREACLKALRTMLRRLKRKERAPSPMLTRLLAMNKSGPVHSRMGIQLLNLLKTSLATAGEWNLAGRKYGNRPMSRQYASELASFKDKPIPIGAFTRINTTGLHMEAHLPRPVLVPLMRILLGIASTP